MRNHCFAFFQSCFLVFLSFTLSRQISKTNICVNCKHFSNPSWNSAEFGHCMFYPKEEQIPSHYLVTGKPMKEDNDNKYYYCLTARTSDDMCGLEGKYFEKACKPRRFRFFSFNRPTHQHKNS